MKPWTINEVVVLGTSLAVMLAITCVLHYFLHEKSFEVRSIPLKVIAGFMIILEVIKQVYFIFNGYTPQWLPFHFCSLFFVWFALAQFAKGGLAQVGRVMGLVTCVLLCIVFYITPRTIVGESCSHLFSSFYNFHTVLYHNLVFQYFFITLALNMYQPEDRDYFYIFASFSVYLPIVVCASYLTGYNYTNILYSDFAPLEYIRVHTNQILYILILYAIAVLGSYAIRFIYGRIKQRVRGTQEKIDEVDMEMCENGSK